MQCSVAVKTLQALLGDSDQHFIMIMCVVGMAAKMGMNTFNASLVVTSYVNPVICHVILIHLHNCLRNMFNRMLTIGDGVTRRQLSFETSRRILRVAVYRPEDSPQS